MIRRLYVHNFRCLENFELPVSGQSSVLLIGNNGSGKTTVGLALEILQKIARGTNRVGDLVKPKDLPRRRTDVPVRFEIDVELEATIYHYAISFEFFEGLREVRVHEERFEAGGKPVYTRVGAQVLLARMGQEQEMEANDRSRAHSAMAAVLHSRTGVSRLGERDCRGKRPALIDDRPMRALPLCQAPKYGLGLIPEVLGCTFKLPGSPEGRFWFAELGSTGSLSCSLARNLSSSVTKR